MRMLLRMVLLMLAIPTLAACATTSGGPHAHAGDYPEAAAYDAEADAKADLAAARTAAAANNHLTLVIFGANWCHDSRALAGWLQTPRFQALTASHYEVVYIDAGVPQTGEGRNLELAAALGVEEITGTPSMLVIDNSGHLLNTPDDARSWRNAASRDADAIFDWLESWTLVDAASAKLVSAS